MNSSELIQALIYDWCELPDSPFASFPFHQLKQLSLPLVHFSQIAADWF